MEPLMAEVAFQPFLICCISYMALSTRKIRVVQYWEFCVTTNIWMLILLVSLFMKWLFVDCGTVKFYFTNSIRRKSASNFMNLQGTSDSWRTNDSSRTSSGSSITSSTGM